MNESHLLTVESDNGVDIVYACSEPGCGRRVALNRSGELTLVTQGDFYALHSSETPGLHLGIAAAQQR